VSTFAETQLLPKVVVLATALSSLGG